MKHGPNALIDENLPVVVLATHDRSDPASCLLYEKTLSNMQEVKAREGRLLAIVTEGDTEARKIADDVIEIPGRPTFSRRFWKSSRCSCSLITSRFAWDATWISRAISRKA